MKDQAIKIHIEQIAGAIAEEIRREMDGDRQCRLQDAQEYLRRAFWAIDGTATEDNQTTIEGIAFMRGGAS